MITAAVSAVDNWEHPAEDAHVVLADRAFAAVFDGLAGHGAGDVASTLAADTVKRVALAGPPGPVTPAAALNTARDELLAARAAGPYRQMTCTAVACLIDETADVAHVAWCGDSRAYRLGLNGMLVRVTDDHDLLGEQYLRGHIDQAKVAHTRAALDEARTASDAWRLGGALAKKMFKRKHLMTSDLSDGPIDVVTVPVAKGETIVLCSDGIHDNLRRSDMQRLAAAAGPDPHAIAGALVAAAQDAARTGQDGAHPDDLTCVALTRAA